MRRSMAFFAVLSAIPSPAWACAEVPLIEATTDYFGACEQFVVLNRVRTDECPGQFRLVDHVGESAFLTFDIGSITGRVSFWGTYAPAENGASVLLVRTVTDTVIERDGDQPSRTVEADGTCTFGDPAAGPVRVDCTIGSGRSRSALAFVSSRAPAFERVTASIAGNAPTRVSCLTLPRDLKDDS